MVTKENDESTSPNLSFKVLSLAAKLASKLSISLTVAADARPLKSSRHVDEKSKPHFKHFWCKSITIWFFDRNRSVSGDRSGDGISKERSPSAARSGRERNPSAAVRLARQSAKDQMRAAGLAKEKGEADMEQFVKVSWNRRWRHMGTFCLI